MKKEEIEENLEKLKENIQKKGEEIEQLKKTIEELNNKIRDKEDTKKKTELSDMLGEVSELIDTSFNIFGISSRDRGTSGRNSGLAGLINNLARLAEKSENFQKKFELDGKEGVIDFRIRSGPLKRSTTKRRGIYIKKHSPKRVEPQGESSTPIKVKPIEEREPIVDIFEEKDKVTVMIELPGVTEKDIDWDVEGDTITIKASTSEKKYYKEIDLPRPCEKKGAESTYRNGILEVKLVKTPEETPENT